MYCKKLFSKIAIIALFIFASTNCQAETLRKAESLEQLLKAADVSTLVSETHRRGDPKRGALVFYRSTAACVNCHASGSGQSPLGPNIAKLLEGIDPAKLTDEYLIQSLLFPSKHLRKGFETVSVLTDDGKTLTGIVVDDNEQQLVLRSPTDLEHTIVIKKETIDTKTTSAVSIMPEGLISAFRDQAQFFDLAAYVIQVARGGPSLANELKPTEEQLAVNEDWLNQIGRAHV